MATLAVFLSPERVGIARVKTPGAKPSYSSVQWRPVENVPQLLEEPALLTALVREMVADEEKYDIYLNLWPAAYKAVMFSYDKRRKSDLVRLRQAELETVFRGELNKLYTFDLPLSKGKPSADGKSHNIIFTIPRQTVVLLTESFRAHKMKLKRIAPMDVAAAEAALKYWAPRDKDIHVSMVLDESCTSISFLSDGAIHAIRTIPNGFGSILSSYETITGLDRDACVELIRSNGVKVPTELFDMPAIQDDVLRMLNRITGETVRTLHNTFGDDAVIGKILLCGNFVSTVGLVDYLNSMLDTECEVISADTLSAETKNDIVLNENDLDALIPLASTASPGSDLMAEMKKIQGDKVKSIALCTGVALVAAGLMAITPIQMSRLQKEAAAYDALLNQPAYLEIRGLFDERAEISRNKAALEQAIEELPHGGTNTAGIIEDLYELTSEYGSVLSLKTDYGTQIINIGFTTLNYDSFIYWQKEISEGGRFTFKTPPTFEGNGLMYTVTATMTATDFASEPEVETETDPAAETENTEG